MREFDRVQVYARLQQEKCRPQTRTELLMRSIRHPAGSLMEAIPHSVGSPTVAIPQQVKNQASSVALKGREDLGWLRRSVVREGEAPTRRLKCGFPKAN